MSKTTPEISRLIEAAHRLALQGLCPATGGNFSLRSDNTLCMSRSGTDKSNLSEADMVLCDLEGKPLQPSDAPSAEGLLHATLYQKDSSIKAVFHTHSVPATLISRVELENGSIKFSGYEMQKSIKGISSHEQALSLPILCNSQDMESLRDELLNRWEILHPRYGFLLSGHGLYAWGESVQEALRHSEGYEFLLNCELQRRLLER